MFEAWRTGGDAKRIAPAGSVDWMFAEYKGSNKYTKLPARTRSGYDRAMGDVADYILKDGRRVGELHVKSVNAEFVDKIYDKLKIGPDGTPRKSECPTLDYGLQARLERRPPQQAGNCAGSESVQGRRHRL